MHTPTTTMRLWGGAMRHQLVDHAGHANRLEHGHLALAADAGPRLERRLLRGSTTSSAPSWRRAHGGRGRGRWPRSGRRRAGARGDHGKADRPAADDDGAVAGRSRTLTACRPTAIGSVSAACDGARPLGTGSVKSDDSSIRSL